MWRLGKPKRIVLTTATEIENALSDIHGTSSGKIGSGGHFGHNKVMAILQQRMWWTGMVKDVDSWVGGPTWGKLHMSLAHSIF